MDNPTRRFISLVIFAIVGFMYFILKEMGSQYCHYFKVAPIFLLCLIWFSNKK